MDRIKRLMQETLAREPTPAGEHRYIQEFIGRDLIAFLTAALPDSISFELEGAGVHWHVTASRGQRRCQVYCLCSAGIPQAFQFGSDVSPTGGVVYAAEPGPPRKGAGYSMSFDETGTSICTGRTRDREAVAACMDLWLEKNGSRDALYSAFPFVDVNRRALGHLKSVIDDHQARAGSDVRATLHDDQFSDAGAELWIYAGARSCRVQPSENTSAIGCAFLLEAIQLARLQAETPAEVAGAVHLWVTRNTSLTELEGELHALEIAPFADIFERGDIARWHWSIRLAKARDASDGNNLAPYLPLIERIVDDPVISRFYVFTSLATLCFSRCSRYVFSTDGMPFVRPAEEGYAAASEEASVRGDADTVCTFLRTELERVGGTPWHGTNEDSLIAPINELLASEGGAIRVRWTQRRQWTEVRAALGDRSATLMLDEDAHKPYQMVARHGGRSAGHAYWRTREGLADGIRLWVEEGASLQQLAEVAHKFEPA